MTALLLNKANISNYKLLMRMDKPIGSYLLLWPTLWALWLASRGSPSLVHLVIFGLGVFVMRSAGCVINDYADRHFDGSVERTKNRPIASGKVSSGEALQLFALLIALGFLLVLMLNWQTIALSVVALLLAASYPFMKRFTHFPQVVLGAAFSWSMPMAFMAVTEKLPDVLWLLYAANLCWTVAYDTMYGMVDRDDDIKIGLKSTAIKFGRYDKLMVLLLQITSLVLLVLVGIILHFTAPFYAALVVAAGLFAYQHWLIRDRDTRAYFKAFLHNNYVGMTIFIGIVGHYWLSNA
ncbi:MAG: 4-hydroxybenzoate polyprenyltransferase [Alteromonadaceae bacterium]|jgi:4-hydroxybenzoate polyprenyltransferase